MSKTLSKVGNLITKVPVKSIPPSMAIDAFQSIQSAYAEYKQTVAIEKTKRQAISAWRDVEISKIQAQKRDSRRLFERVL